MSSRVLSGSLLGALVLLAFLSALFLYAKDADAAIAIHDGIWYAIQAEANPKGSILPHHPLFHLIVLAILPLVKYLVAADAAHAAVRIVAGAGAGLLLIVLAGLARGRAGIGLLFALALFATRGFLMEAGTGENLLPAIALAIATLGVAASRRPRPVLTALLLALALLLRQDNVFIVPGVGYLLARSLPPGRRFLRSLAWVAGTGLAVLAAYALIWRCVAPEESLARWMLRYGADGSWSGSKGVEWARTPELIGAIGAACVGRHWPVTEQNLWLGPLVLGAFVAAGGLLRGRDGDRGFACMAFATIVLRVPFLLWYEPENFEWQVMTLALAAAAGARLASGEALTAPRTRACGIGLLLAIAMMALVFGVPNLLRLRQTTLMNAVRGAIEETERPYRLVAYGAGPGAAMALLHERAEVLYPSPAETLPWISQQMHERPSRMLVLGDRFVIDGMPETLDHPGDSLVILDYFEETREIRLVRSGGIPFGILVDPAPK